jgi:hypothetical protein
MPLEIALMIFIRIPANLKTQKNHQKRVVFGGLRLFTLISAERGGFEPPVHGKADNGFRDRRIQPLCHLSVLNYKNIIYCITITW